jgi:hypothetical protein
VIVAVLVVGAVDVVSVPAVVDAPAVEVAAVLAVVVAVVVVVVACVVDGPVLEPDVPVDGEPAVVVETPTTAVRAGAAATPNANKSVLAIPATSLRTRIRQHYHQLNGCQAPRGNCRSGGFFALALRRQQRQPAPSSLTRIPAS